MARRGAGGAEDWSGDVIECLVILRDKYPGWIVAWIVGAHLLVFAERKS